MPRGYFSRDQVLCRQRKRNHNFTSLSEHIAAPCFCEAVPYALCRCPQYVGAVLWRLHLFEHIAAAFRRLGPRMRWAGVIPPGLFWKHGMFWLQADFFVTAGRLPRM